MGAIHRICAAACVACLPAVDYVREQGHVPAALEDVRLETDEVGLADPRGFTVASSYRNRTTDGILTRVWRQRMVNWQDRPVMMHWISGAMGPDIVDPKHRYMNELRFEGGVAPELVQFDVAAIPVLGGPSLMVHPQGAGPVGISGAPSHMPRARAFEISLARVLPALRFGLSVVSSFTRATGGTVGLLSNVRQHDVEAGMYVYQFRVSNGTQENLEFGWVGAAVSTTPIGLRFTVAPGAQEYARYIGDAPPILITDVALAASSPDDLAEVPVEFLAGDSTIGARMDMLTDALQGRSGAVQAVVAGAYVPRTFQIRGEIERFSQ